MSINTIIFDIGNVLVDFRWKGFIADFGYDKEIQERIAKATVLDKVWHEFDRGILGEEELMDKFVANDPGIEDEIRRTYRSIKGLLVQFDYTKPWIRELKDKGVRVLYLSNYSEKADRECADEMDFFPLMDGGILSYKVKLIKPDAAIYELLTETYGLTPSECLFFDDTPVNVEAARKHGYNAEVFTGYETAMTHLNRYTSPTSV
ncbi:MAG: HAD family phosphatase [Lachnospiraceae bacterium]|nr:HAD family phosphatase [Lachnospiraceae bacterium]